MAKRDKSEIARLRAEAKKARERATRKISRVRNTSGMNIAGTEYDVRRDPKAIDKYNTAQLAAYIRKLNSFTSRDTSFVALAGNVPVSKKEWDSAVKAAEKRNMTQLKRYAKYANVKLPSGASIDEMLTTLYGDPNKRLTADGNRTVSPNATVNLKPHLIQGKEALNKLRRKFREETDPENYKYRVKNWRRGFRKMLIEIGSLELMEKEAKLTDNQFMAAWVGGMHKVAEAYYVAAKAFNEGKGQKDYAAFETGQTDSIDKFLNWAGNLKNLGNL